MRSVFVGPARYRGAYGGRGSAKSRSFAAMLLIDGMREPGPILCARELQTSLRDSVHAELCGLVDDLGLDSIYEYGREYLRTRPGFFPGGAQTEFVYSGLRHNSQGIKSKSRFRRCWVEEAEYVSEQSWKDLVPTIRMPGSEIWLTWNPEVKGSATDRRFIETQPADARIVEVNWRDNPWFPPVLDQERLNDLRRDPDSYQHVWEGKYATRSDAQVMHGKWSVEAFTPNTDPKAGPVWNGPYDGADWGFSADPTVRVRCWIHDSRLHVEREAYGKHVELLDLPALFDHFPDSRKVRIRGDAARPETISYMKGQGFAIEAAAKWPGSVEDGIAHLRGAYDRIVVHPRCVRTAEEFRLYSYKVDRLTGDVLADVVDKHNHCFPAGTMVTTDLGDVPIESVTSGTMVLTRNGFHPVKACGMTRQNAALSTLTLSNGATLTGTPCHPIWTKEHDFARLDSLRYGDTIEYIGSSCANKKGQSWQGHEDGSTRITRDPRKSSWTASCIDAIRTRSVGLTGFISRRLAGRGFTSSSTRSGTARSLMAGTSTTTTTTHSTTPERTSWPSPPKTTEGFTSAFGPMNDGIANERSPTRYDRLRLSGIDPKKVVRGTENMAGSHGKAESPYRSSASDARWSSRLATLAAWLDSARTNAGPPLDASPALTTKSENAQSAADRSSSIAIPRPRPVPVHVVGVSDSRRNEDVYDLTVDGPPEFYADGVLVHNCVDAIRYALQPLIKRPGTATAAPLRV